MRTAHVRANERNARSPNSVSLVPDRRCTNEQWVRDLLVDGCLTYHDQYWCLCSTDLCNAGDFTTIRGYDDCSNDPCPSGTVCLDTRDGFTCICPPWQEDCTYGKCSEKRESHLRHRTSFSIECRLLVQKWRKMYDGSQRIHLRMSIRIQRPQLRNTYDEVFQCRERSIIIDSFRRYLYSQSLSKWWYMSIARITQFHMSMPTRISRIDLSDM